MKNTDYRTEEKQMEGKTCCVTGHRDIPQKEINKVKAALRREVDLAVKEGFTRFMSGFAEGVDQYFAEIVLEKKKKNPALELIAVIPYQKRLDNLMEKRRTYEMLEACADVVVMQEKYHPSVYSHRNRYMAEHSDRVIAVYDGREKGGTVRTIRFAHQMKKEFREIPVGGKEENLLISYYKILESSSFHYIMIESLR